MIILAKPKSGNKYVVRVKPESFKLGRTGNVIFEGTVVESDYDKYPKGFYSESWVKKAFVFENSPAPIIEIKLEL